MLMSRVQPTEDPKISERFLKGRASAYYQSNSPGTSAKCKFLAKRGIPRIDISSTFSPCTSRRNSFKPLLSLVQQYRTPDDASLIRSCCHSLGRDVIGLAVALPVKVLFGWSHHVSSFLRVCPGVARGPKEKVTSEVLRISQGVLYWRIRAWLVSAPRCTR